MFNVMNCYACTISCSTVYYSTIYRCYRPENEAVLFRKLSKYAYPDSI